MNKTPSSTVNHHQQSIQLEKIIIELSHKEAIQNEKRERCSQLFDSIQSYQNKINVLREQIRDTQNELQQLDDEIDDLQRAREKLVSLSSDVLLQSKSYSKHDDTNDGYDYQDQGQDQGRMNELRDEILTCKKKTQVGTLDGYFQTTPMTTTATTTNNKSEGKELELTSGVSTLFASSASTSTSASTSASANHNHIVSGSIFPPQLQSHFQDHNRSGNGHIGSNISIMPTTTAASQNLQNPNIPSDHYPWFRQLFHELRNTFGIQNFRDHQHEIINCTMSGYDVFVIMRTGGGKSLTYQLPALLEGKGPDKKVTVVVSPLLSLIRDQEEQMNQFSKGTATSFSSGLSSAEQTRRWNLVRDPMSGICLIFVTPEKVYKSGRFKSELEKLNRQNRLGRFVVDECHCCSVWGFDFRTDYTKLGILKQHFPRIPLIAVTATASDRVRNDCCSILKIGSNYRFFRSTANRPNLRYCVRVKPEKADDVVEEMAKFIREQHRKNAGIIYCFSKKEANAVAEKLSSLGISAKPYHSDVSDTAKERLHRSWMNNKTQVVVATIAFGLGINKPDVRFVLHHSLSKTLEAYYQESGRAGRDGGQADCVLYYSPKDVCRTLGMIHGERTEIAFWSMARYAQMHGDDALCKRIILSNLGEPGSEKIEDVINSGGANSTTEEREIGKLCKDLVRMIYESGRDMTMAQIVQMWRSKGKDTPD